MKQILIYLKELCLTPGISEKEIYSGISQRIFNIAKTINNRTIIDGNGNVISCFGNGDKKIIIDAHLDEVGFFVYCKKNNKIKLNAIGDIDLQKINHSDVFVISKNIKGKISKKNNDIFLETKDKTTIVPGDIVSFSRLFSCRDTVIKGTALDNRVGCACSLNLMKKIRNKDLKNIQIIFTFTANEENDRSNLDIIANRFEADFGIIIDSAYAQPINFETDKTLIPVLGAGCAIQDSGAGFVVDENIINTIKNYAKGKNIPFQNETPPSGLGRTNLSKLQQINKPGCVINIPVRNQHERISEANANDLYAANKLIWQIIKLFISAPETINNFKIKSAGPKRILHSYTSS